MLPWLACATVLGVSQLPAMTIPETAQGAIAAARQLAAQLHRVPPATWTVQTVEAQTWPNGCLGLGGPDELCTQALVPGWRIVLTDGSRRYGFRSDRAGRQVRPELQ
ncbi:MAG: hypothetical protein ACUVSQ_05265 [Pseudanabaenaceae cyanobacterium]